MKVLIIGGHHLYRLGQHLNPLIFIHLRTILGNQSKATFSKTCKTTTTQAQEVSTIQDLFKLAGTLFQTMRKRLISHFGASQKLLWSSPQTKVCFQMIHLLFWQTNIWSTSIKTCLDNKQSAKSDVTGQAIKLFNHIRPRLWNHQEMVLTLSSFLLTGKM